MCFYTVCVAEHFEPLNLRCFKAVRRVANKLKKNTQCCICAKQSKKHYLCKHLLKKRPKLPSNGFEIFRKTVILPPVIPSLLASHIFSLFFLHQARGSWSTLVRHGTRAASSVTAASSRLAPSPSYPTRTSTTAWPATRTSSPLGAHAVKRSGCSDPLFSTTKKHHQKKIAF